MAWVVAVAPPDSADRTGGAELDDRARTAWKQGRHDEAIELFRAAERLHPTAKYAYNLAFALHARKRMLEAWEALERVRTYGDLVGENSAKAEALRITVERTLLQTHAYISLEVAPAGARVSLDGAAWSPSIGRWIESGRSTLEVQAEGYVTQRLSWEHAIGARHARVVRLKRIPEKPVVTRPIEKPVVVAKPPPPPSPSKAMTIAGWTTLGVGVALAASSGAAFASADTIATDLEALNSSAEALSGKGEYTDYRSHFESERARRDDAIAIGWTLVGVGVAAVAAGAVLLALDTDETVTVAPTAGGLLLGGRF